MGCSGSKSGVIPGGIAEGVRVRVAICGAAGVGKSALVTRLIHPTAFRPEYVPDTKVEVCVKAMRIKTSIEAEVPPRLLSCEVYDIPGNLEVPLDAELIGSLHGIVICVDGSINDPFKGVYRYIDHMRGLPSGSPMAREGPRASKLSSMRTKSISAGSREPPTPLSIPHADDGNVGGSHGRLSSAASQPSVPAAGSVVSGAEHWEDLRGQIPAVVCVCKMDIVDEDYERLMYLQDQIRAFSASSRCRVVCTSARKNTDVLSMFRDIASRAADYKESHETGNIAHLELV